MLRRYVCALLVVAAWGLGQTARANVALEVSGPVGPDTPSDHSNHGWEFVANGPITVTQLGLFDYNNGGFQFDRPIGLFRVSDSALLASGTIHAGTVDMLLAGFRYVDTLDVTLVTGQSYVVSFFNAIETNDRFYTEFYPPATMTIDPAITYVQGGWGWPVATFAMPNVLDPDTLRIGPNFLFTTGTVAIPAPGALLLGGLGVTLLGCRRRRLLGKVRPDQP
jgi:hypothetical protein